MSGRPGTPQAPDTPEASDASEARSGSRGFMNWLDTRFRSAAAIYGLIVYAAFLSISADHAEDAWDLLDDAILSLLVFYVAHVFAHTLTDHGENGLGRAVRHAMTHSAGMLYAALPATIVCIAGGFDESPVGVVYLAAMSVTVVVLALLGYIAYWRRGAHVGIRLLGAAGTAVLGILIVLLEYSIH